MFHNNLNHDRGWSLVPGLHQRYPLMIVNHGQGQSHDEAAPGHWLSRRGYQHILHSEVACAGLRGSAPRTMRNWSRPTNPYVSVCQSVHMNIYQQGGGFSNNSISGRLLDLGSSPPHAPSSGLVTNTNSDVIQAPESDLVSQLSLHQVFIIWWIISPNIM